MTRMLRRFLGGRPVSTELSPFARLSNAARESQNLVMIFYLCSIYISGRLLHENERIVESFTDYRLLWPIKWMEYVGIPDAIEIVSICAFVSSLFAFQFRHSALARLVFFVLYFMSASVPNSVSAINHGYHAWIWLSFVFVFLPSGDPARFGRARQLSYCTTIFAAQTLFLFFYTMAGFWKVSTGIIDLVNGAPGSFSPGRLSWTLADRVVQTGADPVLADIVIRNVWLGWPMFMFVMYVQFFAVVIVLRPRLHVLWGYLLILFHVGTWLLLDIIFVQQVLLLALLFVLSPFRVTARPLEMVREIPILGLVLERVVPRSVWGGRHERPAYPDHL